MTKRSFHSILGRLGLVVLTCSILGAANITPWVGVAQAAAGNSARPLSPLAGPTPKSTPIDYCLEIYFFTLTAVDTNTAELTGEVFNNCGFTITRGRTNFYSYVQGCGRGGVSKDGEDGGNWYTLYPKDVISFDAYVIGRCEVCKDGKAVDFPSFTSVLQADSSGTGLNNQLVEDTGTPTKSIGMPNSPLYAFPCP